MKYTSYPIFCMWFMLSNIAHAQRQEKPNIVFILADDLGFGDVGFNGQQLFQTPNIDELARQGMRFSDFYSGTTVCAPSRSALLTGQHSGHTFIRGNIGVEPEGQYPIADSVFTIAELLQEAGYKTGSFGKWGLGPVGSQGAPNQQGFDEFYGYNCQSLAHRYYPTHLWDNAKKVILKPNGAFENPEIYAPDQIQKKALAFIEQNQDRPFFLFLPYILPHAELAVPNDSLFLLYKGKFPEHPYSGDDYGLGAKPSGYISQDHPRATFAAMVARLDMYVGQVMQKLESLGLAENTIVVFTSDNGPHREGGADPEFFNSGGGFRGFKRDLYEGGIRVPFVVRWPGVVKANSTNDFIGAFWDVFPTFADISAIEHSKNVDGISILPTLTAKGTQTDHPYLYWEFHEQGGKQAIRKGNWKAIRLNAMDQTQSTVELYDLLSDPGEKNDIADKHSDLVQQMEVLMDGAHRETPLFPFTEN